MGLIPLYIFINNLDDGVECTISKFADNTELGGVADIPEGHAAIQRGLSRQKWADRNLMKLNKKCKVLHLESNNPRYQDVLGATQKSNLAENFP